MVTSKHPNLQLHHDHAVPLPEYGPSPVLERLYDLSAEPAPEASKRFVRTAVHEIRRPDGSLGHQVVNSMADGVSLLPIDVVQGRAYAILVDQMRYPHRRPGDEAHTLAEVARAGRIGRWSREVMSGGVDAGETLEQAAVREAEEEGGIIGLDPGRIKRLFPTLKSSVGINDQTFNLFYAKIDGAEEWKPELAHADIEEGNITIGAYRLDTAVPEMIRENTVWEMSSVLALTGLYNVTELRKYL